MPLIPSADCTKVHSTTDNKNFLDCVARYIIKMVMSAVIPNNNPINMGSSCIMLYNPFCCMCIDVDIFIHTFITFILLLLVFERSSLTITIFTRHVCKTSIADCSMIFLVMGFNDCYLMFFISSMRLSLSIMPFSLLKSYRHFGFLKYPLKENVLLFSSNSILFFSTKLLITIAVSS